MTKKLLIYYGGVGILFVFWFLLDELSVPKPQVVIRDLCVGGALASLLPFLFIKINAQAQRISSTFKRMFFSTVCNVFLLCYLYFIARLIITHTCTLRGVGIGLLMLETLVCMTFGVIACLKGQHWFTQVAWPNISKWVLFSAVSKQQDISVRKFFIEGLLLFIVGIVYIETCIQPMYFMQDDNFHQFFPVIAQAMKGVFEQGVFPEINPYQMMGIPTTSLGVYALLCPFLYIAYAFATYVLHNVIYTIDVFVIFHLVLAYIFAFWAARKLHINSLWSMIYALSYSLSGFSLVAVRSWYYMAPITAFAPLFVCALEYIRRNPCNWKYLWGLGSIVGLLAYSGNIQMLSYICGFYAVAVLLVGWGENWSVKRHITALVPLVLGGIISLPLTYVTMDVLRKVDRFMSFEDTWYVNFQAFFMDTLWLPLQGTVATNQVLLVAGLCGGGCLLAVGLSKWKNTQYCKQMFANNVYLILGVAALVLSFGQQGVLWEVLHALPVFNAFTHPSKMVIFINLFLLLAGCQWIGRVCVNKWLQRGLVLLSLVLIALHIHQANVAYFTYNTNEYKPIESLLPSHIKQQPVRFASLSMDRSLSPVYSLTLQNNFATWYGLLSINLYDSFLEILLPENAKILQILPPHLPVLTESVRQHMLEYGVKYVVFSTDPAFVIPNYVYLKNNFPKVAQYRDVAVYDIGNPKPLCYVQDTLHAVPVSFNTQGAVIDTRNIPTGTTLILNMLYRPYYRLMVNGKQYPVEKDELDRMKFVLPQLASSVHVRYVSPWRKGIGLAVLALVGFLCVYYTYMRRKQDE